MSPGRYPWPGTGGGTDDTAVDALSGWGSWGVSARVATARPEPPAGQSSYAGAGSPSAPQPPPACLMATRVLTMSARLGPVQQPEEPVFAQLKPVLGARDAAIFPGEDLKQQQQPPPPQQQQHPGGGGGGGGAATLPAEEMVQVGSGHPFHTPPAIAPLPRRGAAAEERAGGTGWGRAAGRGQRG